MQANFLLLRYLCCVTCVALLVLRYFLQDDIKVLGSEHK